MARIETWARHIRKLKEYMEISSDFRAAYETDIGEGYNPEVFLIYCPPAERYHKALTEKLLYLFNSSLIYIEREDWGLNRRQFDAKRICVLETGFVLLDSWMTIVGWNGREFEAVTIYHNCVVSLFFEKMVEMLRTIALGLEDPPQFSNSVSCLMQQVSYKYINYTHNMVFEAEEPVSHIFQSLIKTKRYKIFRDSLTNDHIIILTKSELIQITEGMGLKDSYGRTNTFFIRKHIDGTNFSEIDDTGRLQVTISSKNYSRSTLFDEKNKANVIELLSQI